MFSMFYIWLMCCVICVALVLFCFCSPGLFSLLDNRVMVSIAKYY